MTELHVRRDSKRTVSIRRNERVLLRLYDDEVLDVARELINAVDEHGDRGRWCHHGGCRHWFEPECSSSCDTISAVSNPPASPDPGGTVTTDTWRIGMSDDNTVDEVVMENANVHLEDLGDAYMLIVENSEQHIHLTIPSRRGKGAFIYEQYEMTGTR